MLSNRSNRMREAGAAEGCDAPPHRNPAIRRWLTAGVALLTLAMPQRAMTRVSMILVNGRIAQMDVRRSTAQAMAIDDGRIVAVGDNARVRRLADSGTVVIDLGGRTVVPGLIDTHIHAMADGITYAARLDMADVRDMAGMLATVRGAAERTPAGQWIVIAGAWSKDQLRERRLPAPAELQAEVPGRPVFVLHRNDAAVVNTPALEALATALQDASASFRVERDAAGAVIRPIGSASLASLIADRLALAPVAKRASLAAYFAALNRVGITGIIDQGGIDPADYRLLFDLWRRQELPLRVRMNFMVEWPDTRPPADRSDRDLTFVRDLVRLSPTGFGDDWLRTLGLGEILATGMWDGPLTRHVPIRPEAKAEFARFAGWAAANGYTIGVHATQDSTAAAILDVFEAIAAKQPIAPLRWKIEHVEDASDATLDRMKRLGVGYSIQDRMFLGGDAYVAEHGAAVSRRSPPINTALAKGLSVTAGTDGSSPFNPFVTLRWLLDGRSAAGTPSRDPAELPSRADALRLYTSNAAFASFDEAQRGSLEIGKSADLAVLDRDYFTVPIADIDKIRPVLTITGGKIVYYSTDLRHQIPDG